MVSEGNDYVNLDQYIAYMISISRDTDSPQQLKEAFHTLAGGKEYVTEQDMRMGQLTEEQIQFFKASMPPKFDGYDYVSYLQGSFV